MEERIACAFKPLKTWCYVFPKFVTVLVDGLGKLFVRREDVSDLFSTKIKKGKNERRVINSQTVVYTHVLCSKTYL